MTINYKYRCGGSDGRSVFESDSGASGKGWCTSFHGRQQPSIVPCTMNIGLVGGETKVDVYGTPT